MTKKTCEVRKKKAVYIAGPLGFNEAGRDFLHNRIIPFLKEQGFEILDPWALTSADLIESASLLPYGQEKKEAWRRINFVIGRNNADAIQKCDVIIAILDGPDVDSGTAAEIGYGSALGKLIIGYRNDFRLSSDNEGCLVNLQVEHFIRLNGGEILTSLENLKKSFIMFGANSITLK